MAVIVQRTFPLYSPDKALSLANEDYVRAIPWTWNSIRIAILYTVASTGGGNIANAKLVFGLCSGTTQPFGHPSCTNFIGACPHRYNGTLSYNAGYYLTDQSHAVKNVGGTVTTAAQFNGGPRAYHSGTSKRSMASVQITKGSPNYTIITNANANDTVDWDTTEAEGIMQQQLSIAAVYPSAGGGTVQSLYQTTFAADETAGTFNAINIHWNNANYPVEIYHLVVTRYA